MRYAAWLGLLACACTELDPNFIEPSGGSTATVGSDDGATSTSTSTTATSTTSGTTSGSSTGGSTGGVACVVDEPWWDTNWTYRVRFDLNLPDASLNDDVIARVELDPAWFDYTLAAADGADLRLVSGDGSTVLAHDVDSWAPGERSQVWVRLPMVSSEPPGDRLFLYFGNPGALSVEDEPVTWSAGFVGVWHCAPDFADASAEGHDGTNVGGLVAPGMIGDAVGFAGDGSHVAIPGSPSLATFTGLAISAVVRFQALAPGTANNVIIEHGSASEVQAENSHYRVRISGDGTMALQWERMGGTDQSVESTEPANIAAGTWHHVMVVRNAQTSRVVFYLDGSRVGDRVPFVNGPGGGMMGTVRIGASFEAEATENLAGEIDEIRVAMMARNAAWVAADAAAAQGTLLDRCQVESQ